MNSYYPRHIDSKIFKTLTFSEFDALISYVLTSTLTLCTGIDPKVYGVYWNEVIDVSRWKKYLRTDKIKIAAYNIDKDNVVDNELNQTIGCALHHSSGDVRLAVANNIFRYLTVMNAKWLIAHEISHILLGHIYHKYKNGQKERPINEFQANAIASAIFYNNHDYAETMITESLWVDMVINAKHLAMDMKDDQDVLDYANNLIHKKCICYRSYVKHFEMFHIYVEYLEKKNIFPDLFETVSKKDGGE